MRPIRFAVSTVATVVGLSVAGLSSMAQAQQVTVSNPDLGLQRFANFVNNTFTLNASTTSGSNTYTVGGYGTSPLFYSPSPSQFIGQFGSMVPIRVTNNYYTSNANGAHPMDITDFNVSDFVVFTPPSGPQNASYVNVKAHVVAPRQEVDRTSIDALSKRTLAFGQAVTLPIILRNTSNATDSNYGDLAKLTVSRNVTVNSASGYRNGNTFIYDTPNSEFVLNGPTGGSTFVLNPQQNNQEYSVTITPQRDPTRDLRTGQINFTTDQRSSFGNVQDGFSAGITYFVPGIVAAHSMQSVNGLGGTGPGHSTGGVNAMFTSNAGGDFSTNYSLVDPSNPNDPNALPSGGSFQTAGNPIQRWDITYTGTLDGSATVTFAYDGSLLNGVDPNTLDIEHYNSATMTWEQLTVDSRDVNARTITVITDSFSPFVLSVAAAPEPGTATLVGASMAMLFVGNVAAPVRRSPLSSCRDNVRPVRSRCDERCRRSRSLRTETLAG